MTNIVESIKNEHEAAEAAVVHWTKRRDALRKLLAAAQEIDGLGEPQSEVPVREFRKAVVATVTPKITEAIKTQAKEQAKVTPPKPKPPTDPTARKLAGFPSQRAVFYKAFDAYRQIDKGNWIALADVRKRTKMSAGACKSAIYGLIEKGLVVSNGKPTKSRRYRMAGEVTVTTTTDKPKEEKTPKEVRLSVDTNVGAKKTKQISQESLRALILDALEFDSYAEVDLVTLLESHRDAIARACDTLSANGRIHRQSGKWALVPKTVTV